MNFKGRSAIHRTLKRLAHRLDVYAENMPRFFHGYLRSCEVLLSHANKGVCYLKFFNPLSP